MGQDGVMDKLAFKKASRLKELMDNAGTEVAKVSLSMKRLRNSPTQGGTLVIKQYETYQVPPEETMQILEDIKSRLESRLKKLSKQFEEL